MRRIRVMAAAFQRKGKEARRPLLEAGFEVVDSPREGPFSEEELIPLLRGCSAVIASMDEYTERVFEECPELKVVSRWGTGVDSVDIDAATRHRVLVTNTPGLLADAVADMTFGLMICLARRIIEASAAVGNGSWREVEGVGVYGKCLGIVGLGSVGSAVARRAKGFRMRVLAYDAAPRKRRAEELGVELVSLDRLLSQADFVSLHASLTPENRHMIGERELRLMKKTAYLINTARGGLVDQRSLVRALQEGWIAGAALDTLEEEPPKENEPLLRIDRCLVTPHSAFYCTEAVREVNAQVCRNIIDAFSGRRPRFCVNPQAWDSSWS